MMEINNKCTCFVAKHNLMVKLDLVFVELSIANYCCISIASIIARRLTNIRVNVRPPINISPSLMTWIP